MQCGQSCIDRREARCVEVGPVQITCQCRHRFVELDLRGIEQLDDRCNALVVGCELRQARMHSGNLRQCRGIDVAQRIDRSACAFEQSGSVRQALVFDRNFFPFARLRRERVELIDDPAQPLLLGQRAGGHRLRLLACALRTLPGGECVGGCTPVHSQRTMLVEQLQLRGGPQQRLMRVLAVHVDQVLTELAQLRQGHRRAVDKGLAASRSVDRAAREQQAIVARQVVSCQPLLDDLAGTKRGGDLGALRPLAHDIRITALAQRQQQRVNQNRFSRSGFAAQHRKPRREIQFEGLDDHEIADRQ